MVMAGRSVYLTTLFLGKLEQAVNQYFVHILSLVTIFKQYAFLWFTTFPSGKKKTQTDYPFYGLPPSVLSMTMPFYRLPASVLEDENRLTCSHPGSESDWTIASERQVTTLVMLYIGRLVTCGIGYSITPQQISISYTKISSISVSLV